MSSHSNSTYALQYLEAFRVLYDSKEPVDTIALPMLYCLRHYLELALKVNIKYFSEYSGSRRVLKNLNGTHKISDLADAFIEHWTEVKRKSQLKVNDSVYLEDFNSLIEKLKGLDDAAFSFRFSHDRKENKNFKLLDKVDIERLKRLLKNASILLNDSITVFEDESGLMHDLSKEQVLASQIP